MPGRLADAVAPLAGCVAKRLLAILLLLGEALSAIPAAADEAKVEAYLSAFWIAALWQTPINLEFTAPVALSKFPEGTRLTLAVGGNAGEAARHPGGARHPDGPLPGA